MCKGGDVEDKRSLVKMSNLLLAAIHKLLKEAPIKEMIEIYEHASAASTAYMTMVPYPFNWLDKVERKLKILRLLKEVQEEIEEL